MVADTANNLYGGYPSYSFSDNYGIYERESSFGRSRATIISIGALQLISGI